jgi:ribosome assembly protein RRB1
MPKRTSDVADFEQGTSKAQATGQETARPIQEDEEMGEFEDRYEDEIESEEEIEEIQRDAGEDQDDEDVGESSKGI